jgi:4-hydroxybenzoate polyprenyltransferase
MKRVTDYPQAWLGVCFNWGVLMGATTAVASWAAVNVPAALALHASAWCWTMMYENWENTETEKQEEEEEDKTKQRGEAGAGGGGAGGGCVW